MAKEAHDREDLLRDASGFVRRIELGTRESNDSSTVFCGFRDNGAFSLYWSQDLVFQFNTTCELRRAFWRDRMVASYKRQLHWLEAEGTARVRLKRIPFSETETIEFLELVNSSLHRLEALLRDDHVVEGKVPQDADVGREVLDWLTKVGTVAVALHPGVGK